MIKKIANKLKKILIKRKTLIKEPIKNFIYIKDINEYNEFVNSHLTHKQQEDLIYSSKPQKKPNDPYHIGEYFGFKYKIYNECLRKNFNVDFDLMQDLYDNFIYNNTSIKEQYPYWYYKISRRRETLEDIKQQIKLIQKATSYFTIKQSIVSYRFCSKKELKFLKNKKETEYPCFLSTTLLPLEYKKTQQYNRYKIIKIYIPKNSKGLPTPANTKTTPEYEILFPYNSKLKYLGTEKDYRLNQELEAFLLSN